MDGLTKEQRKRLSLIANLDSIQKDLILAGILGKLDAISRYESQMDTAIEIEQSIDEMIAKAYEKGKYQ
ncbi:hypothetical protein PSYJYH_000010 [Bacillus phage PSYJ-YH]|nr:hypothetical protein PSYJYH_000010 [Bacillus phage PSYJ-YH]